jgi:hypothetical protein
MATERPASWRSRIGWFVGLYVAGAAAAAAAAYGLRALLFQ